MKSLCTHLEESQIELLTYLLQKERNRNKTLERNMEELKKQYVDVRSSSFKVNDSRYSSSSGSMHMISDDKLGRHAKFMDGEVKQHMISARQFLDQFHQNQNLSPIRLGSLPQGESTLGSSNAFFTRRQREPSFGGQDPLVTDQDFKEVPAPPKFDLTDYTIEDRSRRQDTTFFSERISSSRAHDGPKITYKAQKPPTYTPKAKKKQSNSNLPSRKGSAKGKKDGNMSPKRSVTPKLSQRSLSKSKSPIAPKTPPSVTQKIPNTAPKAHGSVVNKSPISRYATQPKQRPGGTQRPSFRLNLAGIGDDGSGGKVKHKFIPSSPKENGMNMSRLRELACQGSERSASRESEKPRTLEQLKEKLKGLKEGVGKAKTPKFKAYVGSSPGKKGSTKKAYRPPARHVKVDLNIETRLGSPAFSIRSCQHSPKIGFEMSNLWSKNESARSSPKVGQLHDLKKLKRVERWGTPKSQRGAQEEQKPGGGGGLLAPREPTRVIKRIKTHVEAKLNALYKN